jgi:hypothetical protein
MDSPFSEKALRDKRESRCHKPVAVFKVVLDFVFL